MLYWGSRSPRVPVKDEITGSSPVYGAMPTQHDGLVQRPTKPEAVGSTPAVGTKTPQHGTCPIPSEGTASCSTQGAETMPV